MERLSDIVKCLICGYELSGTTALSELVRHHPDLDGRFEIGRLLFATAREHEASVYRPFLAQYWDVDEAGEAYIYEADTTHAFYERLIERSSLDGTAKFIYDKTPRYMLELPRILSQYDLPCVVNVRDPRALYYSMKERDPSLTLDGFYAHYEGYANGYAEAKRMFPDRLCLVRNEDLCLDPEGEGRRVYSFLGLEFKSDYVKLENKWKLHTNVRGELGPARMLRFKGELDDGLQREILERLIRWSEWFYEDDISKEYRSRGYPNANR